MIFQRNVYGVICNFLVFGDLLFQPHFFWQYLTISESVKYVALLHVVAYIKESIITKIQKLQSPARNLRAGNKLLALFLKKRSCMGDLLPACKIFIERSASWELQKYYVVSDQLQRGKHKEIPKSSRLEFFEKFLANNFALSEAEDNTSGQLNRRVIADLPLLRTLLAICQKS